MQQIYKMLKETTPWVLTGTIILLCLVIKNVSFCEKELVNIQTTCTRMRLSINTYAAVIKQNREDITKLLEVPPEPVPPPILKARSDRLPDYVIVTVYRVEAGDQTALQTQPNAHTVAVPAGSVFARNENAFLFIVGAPSPIDQKVRFVSDRMPSVINGHETALNRMDFAVWSTGDVGRVRFEVIGRRKIKGTSMVVLKYMGATREQLGR